MLRKHFRITSSTQWIGGENSKGFARKDFADDWERYLPEPAILSDNHPTENPCPTAELPNKDAGPVALSDNAAI